MDIFDKYATIIGRHDKVLEAGTDPFAVRVDEMLSATEAMIGGRRTILLGTNNYLGLTFDPTAIDASVEAARRDGTGTTGSRIANGNYAQHQELELELAAFLKRRSCMVFTTGYQANLAMIAGVAGPRDVIFMDSDSHASIYDGCTLSGAKVIRFRHNDPDDLDRRLARSPEGECKLIIVEGLYSILGDTAPLKAFAEVKKKHGAWLMVDEAHSLGVYGGEGRGVAEAQDCEADVDFVVGTFSKSLAAIGGFGAANHPRFDCLRFCSRPYMFTASPSPASIASARASLRRMANDPNLRAAIWNNAERLHAGLRQLGYTVAAAPGPVAAIRLPDEATAVAAWNRLLQLGVYVNLAVPPGTPNGACLLRCSLSAAHAPAQIDEVLGRFERLSQSLRELATA
ncbi:serine palmitoyltransferase [Arboricoccus pini]|uniref:Serine palmitoyltransferase n=1 Tax=Arboricoccus pini TaxID=1963835 RepID=A0A212QQI5_9PROT|nr:aminotransferase class I/II-fold pyridoxal phosphate-dependent enzyme [Arboricoccus pini]SNB61700.1 serine palmitoyltransferase [Arboricoccus pini]